MKRRAFTLIELLVVIAVILILAAMLMPALSRVRYKARLTVCMNDLRHWGTGLTLYASDNSSFLPYRRAYLSSNRQPHMLKSYNLDDRPLFEEAYGLQYTNCTFVGEPPFDMGSVSSTWVFGTYEIWAGAEIDQNQPASKMRKLGKLAKWTKGAETYEFDILMADQDRTRLGASNSVMTSHPDSLGVLPLYDPGLSYRIYCYFSWDGYRGTLDRNFLHSDGSVTRLMRVQTPTGGSWDSRLVRVPYQSNKTNDPASGYLPEAN